MSFDLLLGNEQLKKNLHQSIQSGRISHFYLISGPQGIGKHTLARLLAAALLCQSTEKPCMECQACRKVMHGTHPDFITIDDAEKKSVTVDMSRQARADMYIMPNESDYKIYLFPRAQDMNPAGQNALLKVLEEPPDYGIFMFLADNPYKLLPTVRSRCTELRLQPLGRETMLAALKEAFPKETEEALNAAYVRSGGILGQAKELLSEENTVPPQTESFLEALSKRDSVLLLTCLVPLEKWKRDPLESLLSSWTLIVENAMISRAGLNAVSSAGRSLASVYSSTELKKILDALKKAVLYLESNVSTGSVCGYLEMELQMPQK